MTFDGREHCGLDDARNTALLCYRMAQDGHRWKITKSLESPQQIVRQPAKLPSEQHLSSTVTASNSNTSCVNGSTSGDDIGNGRHAELSAASPVLPVRSSLHSAASSTTTANPPRPLHIASEQRCCQPSSAAHTHTTTISAGSTSPGNALSATSAVAASAIAAVGMPGQNLSTTTTASSLLHNDNRSVTNACLNRPQPKAPAQPPSSSYTTVSAAAASVTPRRTQHTSVYSSRRHIASKPTAAAAATGVAPSPTTSPPSATLSCVSSRATTYSLSSTSNTGNSTISAPASFLNRPKPAAVAAASTDVEPGRAQPAELLGTAQSEPHACPVSARGSSNSAAYPVTQPIQTQGLTNVACTYATHHEQNGMRAQPRESTNERSRMSTHTTRERAVASRSLKKSTAQDQASAQQCSTVLGSVRTNVQQPHSRSNSSCTTLMAPRTLLDSGPSGMMTSSSSDMASSASTPGHSRSGVVTSQTRRRLGNSTILTPAKRVCVRAAASSHSQSVASLPQTGSVQYSSRELSVGQGQPMQSLPHDQSPRATSRDLAPGPGTVATGTSGGDVRNVSTPAGDAIPCGQYVSAPSLPPPQNTADPGAVGELPVVATVRDCSTASRGCTGIASSHTESVHETTTHCTAPVASTNSSSAQLNGTGISSSSGSNGSVGSSIISRTRSNLSNDSRSAPALNLSNGSSRLSSGLAGPAPPADNSAVSVTAMSTNQLTSQQQQRQQQQPTTSTPVGRRPLGLPSSINLNHSAIPKRSSSSSLSSASSSTCSPQLFSKSSFSSGSNLGEAVLAPELPRPMSINGGGITPPMCACGKRVRRCVASNPGPNQGRTFYTCAVKNRRSNGGSPASLGAKQRGCAYFQWESKKFVTSCNSLDDITNYFPPAPSSSTSYNGSSSSSSTTCRSANSTKACSTRTGSYDTGASDRPSHGGTACATSTADSAGQFSNVSDDSDCVVPYSLLPAL
ncbi:mucin-19-like isoform X2 [Sycon ciliatum]